MHNRAPSEGHERGLLATLSQARASWAERQLRKREREKSIAPIQPHKADSGVSHQCPKPCTGPRWPPGQRGGGPFPRRCLRPSGLGPAGLGPLRPCPSALRPAGLARPRPAGRGPGPAPNLGVTRSRSRGCVWRRACPLLESAQPARPPLTALLPGPRRPPSAS